jgi:P-type Cu+ transporter
MRSIPETRDRPEEQQQRVLLCDHCGDRVSGTPVRSDAAGAGEKVFCCSGCRTVYELLRENNLCDYYSFDSRPGISPARAQRFEFLDDDAVQRSLLDFRSDSVCAATLAVPKIHCSSCIWLIEHLYRIDRGIIHSRVDFLKKTVVIQYNPSVTTLRAVVELLASLGYTPDLEPEEKSVRIRRSSEERSLYYKLGIAGFCFGNIMLLSFPEYLSIGEVERGLRTVFGYLSLLLALPVVFYSASGYFLSAYRGIARKTVTLDVPIALGIAVVFLRSVAEIGLQSGPGFLDSLSGLVFFLLLGRLFQNKTYERLNFERNYRSYFPVGVTVIKNGAETTAPLERIGVGDKILVRNDEIVPSDAYLLNGTASIDYSFVTGESAPSAKKIGDLIYAGGRQKGSAIEVQIAKEVSQSYLTQLWNADAFSERGGSVASRHIADAVGKYFTASIIGVAVLSGAYWMSVDPSRALNAMTGVLIIACPCALALSTPFALGTAMRVLGRANCYVKNTSVIESLASVDSIVFDKTGTLTGNNPASVRFVGPTMTERETDLVSTLAHQSAHPLSRIVCAALGRTTRLGVSDYRDVLGQGIAGTVDDVSVRLGTSEFTGGCGEHAGPPTESRTHVSINGVVKGYFAVGAGYRTGIGRMLDALGQRFAVSLVSGDNESERAALDALYPRFASMQFFQSPMDKLRHVQSLQQAGHRVAMVGDGLNDAGALRQSDAGIAVTEDTGLFSPACDVILEASMLQRLPAILSFARSSVRIVHLSFAFSFLYNAVGLAYAMQGALAPVIAAVLMPLSSISVALFSTLSVRWSAGKRGF